MYSEKLRKLFHTARHAGTLTTATHAGTAGTPGRGPYVQLRLQCEGDVIVAARFLTYGCPPVIACAESSCRWAEGRTLTAAAELDSEHVTRLAGGVPAGKSHCPRLVAEAWRALQPLPPSEE